MMNDTTNVSQVIKERKNKLAIRKGYVGLFIRIMIIAVAVFLVFNQVFLITRVTGSEMFPAVRDGDLIVTFRLQQNFGKNDVVTYIQAGERRVGRTIAQASDVVSIDDTGTLLVNGVVQSGEIMYPTYPKEGIVYPYTVPDNHLFILGDYRPQALDSRDFGSVSMADVEGKVITLLRRRGL